MATRDSEPSLVIISGVDKRTVEPNAELIGPHAADEIRRLFAPACAHDPGGADVEERPHLGELLLVKLGDHRLLVGKIIVERADLDVGALGDGVGRDRSDPALPHDIVRRRHDRTTDAARSRLNGASSIGKLNWRRHDFLCPGSPALCHPAGILHMPGNSHCIRTNPSIYSDLLTAAIRVCGAGPMVPR